jgi:hypothetical protein
VSRKFWRTRQCEGPVLTLLPWVWLTIQMHVPGSIRGTGVPGENGS